MMIRFLKTPKGEKCYCSKCGSEVKVSKTNKDQWKKGSSAYGDSNITACCNSKMIFEVRKEIK